ncbi:MAG: cobalt-precorrin-4 C(11)-methyltransferase [Candidatus Desulfovibrio kirbyi]|uniref:Cobalt-precorrin-4 C(11)-methyltransferase n=1 Tax=Candidatus Desulfovibrio kirbyi TaxID=2696086 RepID=A0A6L2R7D0_9BACT|nr:MAG: cobalt-precorrin-4 C(11)-methyltransferase [Candidatus Desulfovibrio kirbyi]
MNPSNRHAPIRHPRFGTVSFVGAGPGDPELLTIKGQAAIAGASLVLYAGSLVPLAIVAGADKSARVVDSAPLTLEECHALVHETALSGKNVARVHTGDPCLFGALLEQTSLLDRDGIPWHVIPGVTAACAAAAAAGVSFSVPEIAQSLVICRMAGRTPVPEAERLGRLAAHGASLAVYLSGHAAREMQDELLTALPAQTPVLCAHCVGWPEQKLVWTTVEDFAATVAAHALERQTVFLVLPAHGRNAPASRLYAANFAHAFRTTLPHCS